MFAYTCIIPYLDAIGHISAKNNANRLTLKTFWSVKQLYSALIWVAVEGKVPPT